MVNLVEQHPSPISLLPDELIVEILSNLPALDLAIAQQKCKQWYSVAQNHSKLWRNTETFFEKYYRSDKKGRNELQDKDQVAFQYKTFLKGINALLQSSKGQMDCILIDFDSVLLLRGEADLKSQDKRFEYMFDLIRKNDSTTKLWVNYPKRWSSSDIQTQDIFDCVLGSSNLKSLRLTSNMLSPSPFSSFPIDNYLIRSCRLEYFDIDGQHFEKWYNDEGLFTILQNVKHFKLRINQRFPDSNAILYFLSRIQSTLTSIELLDDKDYGGDEFFIGELPFLNESEIILPELIHLTISGDGFQEFLEDLGGFRNAQNFTSEEAERLVQNELANRKLVCPKLECLTMKHDGFGELIVSLQSLVNLKTLKVATSHPDIIIQIVSEIPKFVNVKFEL